MLLAVYRYGFMQRTTADPLYDVRSATMNGPVYTIKQTSSKHRASSSSQLYRVNGVGALLQTTDRRHIVPKTRPNGRPKINQKTNKTDFQSRMHNVFALKFAYF